jgi:translocation and assembly module TamB
MRWAAAALCAALAVAAVLVVAGLLFHRYASSGRLAEDLRRIALAQLSAHLHRQVSLGGISVDLAEGIVVRDLKIAEPGGFQRGVAFSIDEIRVAVNWWRLLSARPNIAGSIAQIDLVRPHVVLRRAADGAWSFADLMAPGGAPAGPGLGPADFRGRVRIRDGSLVFSDALNLPPPPFAVTFLRINGEANFHTGAEVPVVLSAWSADGMGVTLSGLYRTGRSASDFDIAVSNGGVSRWARYLLRLSQLSWQDGRFGGRVHLALTPSAHGVTLQFSAALTLHDVAAVYGPARLAIRHATGSLAVDNAHVESTGLSLWAATSPLEVEGDVIFAGGPWLDLRVRSTAIALETVQGLFFPQAPLRLSGEAGGDVRIAGPVAALAVDGEVTGARGRFNRQRFDGLRTRLQYGAGTLSLTGLRASVGDGRLSGDLMLTQAKGAASYLFSGETSNVDVRALESAGISGLSAVKGRITGRVIGAGSGAQVQMMGDVTMAAGSFAGQSFDQVRAIFSRGSDGAVDLDYLGGRADDSSVFSSGRIGAGGALDLDVLAHNISLADVGARASLRKIPLDGHADFVGKTTGTMQAPVVSGAMTISHGRLGPVTFAHAHGNVTIGRAGIQTTGMGLVNGPARYQISGGVTFSPLEADHLHLAAQDVEAQWLTNAIASAPDATGTLSGSVTVDGPLAYPQVTGRLAFDKGTVHGQRIDHAEAYFAPNRGGIHLSRGEVQVSKSRLFAEGTIDPAGPLDLRVWTDEIAMADVKAALGLDLPVDGTLALTGHAGGSLTVPNLSAEVTAHDLDIGGQRFDVSGAMDFQRRTLRLSSLQLAQGEARYRLSGEIRPGSRPSAGLALDIEHGQIDTLLAATKIELPAPLHGTIDGRIEFSGPLDDPAARLALTLRDAAFGAYTIGTGEADLTLTHGAIDIERFEIHPAQGQLAAKGSLHLRGTSSVEVSAQDLNPDFLRPFFKLDRPLVGKLNFTVQFTGPTQDPTAGLSLTATDVGVSGALVDRVSALAYYAGRTLHIEQALIAKGQRTLVVDGSLPIDPAALGLNPQAPLELHLRLQDADLGFLSLLAPQISDASGTVAGEIDVGGTAATPQMSGFLRSSGGRLRYAALRTPIEDLNVDLAFSQDQIQIRDLSATLGQGRAAVTGLIAISNLRPEDVQLVLRADNVTIDVPGFFAGQVDADLAASGPAAVPTLSGKLTLSQGQITPGAIQGSTAGGGAGKAGGGLAGGLTDVKLDVDLEVGQKVVLVLGPVRTDIVGAVHAGGTLARLLLSGRITSPGGEVQALGANFRLLDGEAVFSESLGVEPQISARAMAIYGDVVVILQVQGLASHPTLSLSSNPPMSQADIITLIGRNVGIPLTSIQRALNLSVLSINYGQQSPALTVGKLLFPNLYISISQVFAGPENQTVNLLTAGGIPLNPRVSNGQAYTEGAIQYFLSPQVLLTFSADTLGDTGMFVMTRFSI